MDTGLDTKIARIELNIARARLSRVVAVLDRLDPETDAIKIARISMQIISLSAFVDTQEW